MTDDAVPVTGQTKLFPRNLTARAAYVVRGNPVSARPESGVENTHPGLEWDQRNLDCFFFAGLSLEFQFIDGARVVGIDPARLPAGSGLLEGDAGKDLRLLYIYGRFGAAPETYVLRELAGLDGYDVLRTIRDLEQGHVLVVVGRTLTLADAGSADAIGQYFSVLSGLQAADGSAWPDAKTLALPVTRDPNGVLLLAALAGTRAEFVASDGVIDPAVVAPGELTRSLCAPWQWDFADCGCHYWASSKPDIVVGAEGGAQTLNFQRVRNKAPAGPPAKDYAQWTADLISSQDMINHWQTLPFVVSERETETLPPPRAVIARAPMTTDAIIEELRYLATVEHALTVNYLYAHYSVDAPPHPPKPPAEGAAQVVIDAYHLVNDRYRAAREVFMIGVDEMRHFRWANEALAILGGQPSFGRAENFIVHAREGDRHYPVKIRPLTKRTLDFLIWVESPSRGPNDEDIDGMYTRILDALPSVAGLSDRQRLRLMEVVKLIIDEGHGHWERLKKVKTLLGSQTEAEYLRLGKPVRLLREGTQADLHKADLQALGDLYYRTLLDGIVQAFRQPAAQRDAIMKQAHRVMRDLHELAHGMASEHVTPLFSYPGQTWQDEAEAGFSGTAR